MMISPERVLMLLDMANAMGDPAFLFTSHDVGGREIQFETCGSGFFIATSDWKVYFRPEPHFEGDERAFERDLVLMKLAYPEIGDTPASRYALANR